jgi:hypothetical protein
MENRVPFGRTKEQRNKGTKEQRNKGTKEQRNKGTKEQGNKGTREPRAIWAHKEQRTEGHLGAQRTKNNPPGWCAKFCKTGAFDGLNHVRCVWCFCFGPDAGKAAIIERLFIAHLRLSHVRRQTTAAGDRRLGYRTHADRGRAAALCAERQRDRAERGRSFARRGECRARSAARAGTGRHRHQPSCFAAT